MIEKINYRDQVRELLLTKMRTGQLSPGNSISLAALARELDVSVTPIREALTQLQMAKIIEAIPNRGFIIPELSHAEAKELYELVATLEAFIVKKSHFSKKDINQLEKLQSKFESCKDQIDRINADFSFHDYLTSKYYNSHMQKILMDTKTRIFFYEKAFMSQELLHKSSEDHHVQIIECLTNEQQEQAAEIIVKNWMLILNYITS